MGLGSSLKLSALNLRKKLRKNIKVKDAHVITNARRSGIIPLFKTSTVEFAFGGLGLNSSQEYPKNQMYKRLRCPGGSSSGSASSVFLTRINSGNPHTERILVY